MRIVASNSDSIGDMILREPLYAQLVQARHELLILARPKVVAVARMLVPAAQVWEIPFDCYALAPGSKNRALAVLQRKIESYAPALLLLAPYVRTRFEEWLKRAFADIPCFGFAGRRYPSGVSMTQKDSWELVKAVEAPIEMHEWDKNRLLCQSVLGRPIAWRRPVVVPGSEALATAQALLERYQVPAGRFWLACVGDSTRNRHLNWNIPSWATVMAHAIQRHGWRFLMVGTAEEHATNRAILAAMKEAARSVTLADDVQLDFTTLASLQALAQGYLGRDSGPMHLAAALGKPVLAIFAGGTWPRFLPLTDQSQVFTLKVPCAGCGHFCHLHESYCIKRIPIEPVIAAVDELAGSLPGPHCHVLPRPPGLARHMEQEAAALGRDRTWLLEKRQRKLKALINPLNILSVGWRSMWRRLKKSLRGTRRCA